MNKKQTIRLNESQFNNLVTKVVKESVKKVLKESGRDELSPEHNQYLDTIDDIAEEAMAKVLKTEDFDSYEHSTEFKIAVEAAQLGFRYGKYGVKPKSRYLHNEMNPDPESLSKGKYTEY